MPRPDAQLRPAAITPSNETERALACVPVGEVRQHQKQISVANSVRGHARQWFGRDAVAWLLRSRRLLLQGHKSAEAFEAALAATPGALRGQWPMSPSCLLLDLRMNGMSGLIVARRERAHRLHGLRELSEREQDVMKLVAQGMSNKEISSRLNIAEGTTKIHTAAVLRALGARNRTEAAFMAAKLVGSSIRCEGRFKNERFVIRGLGRTDKG